jgi:hypothetical protein
MGWPYKSDGQLTRRVLGPPPTEWTITTWTFVLLGGFYLVGFVVFWFRFQAADRRAKSGEPGAAERFNATLRGFPNAMYAKMFGKKPYEVGPRKDERSES